jgi:hypothetical protein
MGEIERLQVRLRLLAMNQGALRQPCIVIAIYLALFTHSAWLALRRTSPRTRTRNYFNRFRLPSTVTELWLLDYWRPE